MSSQSRSYSARFAAQPANSKIYEAYLSALGLDLNDRSRLQQRGLTQAQIDSAKYATKLPNNSPTSINALGIVERAFDLDGVAGFFWDEKRNQRTHFGKEGLLIPSRDVDGNISSLLLRDNNARNNSPKYIAFSTAGKPKGGRAWNTTHCPVVKGAPKEVAGAIIRLTEGLLKADVATALGDHYCVGIHGLAAPENLAYTLEQLQCSTVVLSFDQEDAPDVIKSRKRIYDLIKELGYEVKIETWDSKFKGIDDALAGAPNSVRLMSEEEQAAIIRAGEKADPTSGEWIYVIATERVTNVKSSIELKKSQFADKFGLGSPDAVNALLAQGFPQVDAPLYWPGRPKIIEQDEQRYLNFWTPHNHSATPGDIAPFLRHMEYLFPKEAERQVIMQYIAFHVQFPGEKINWAPLIQGKPGIGKSFLGEMMATILGPSNVSQPSNDELHELYTGWLKHAQLVVVNELMAGGRRELMNKLKPLITDPNARVREMHKMPYDMPNRLNFLFFTNHKDAIIIEEEDRRWYVTTSDSEPQDKRYYIELWDWLQSDQTPGAMLHWAENFDLAGFSAKGHAPKTEARKELVKMSRSALDAWIEDSINDNAWPFNMDLVSVRHLKSPRVSPPEFLRLGEYKWVSALLRANAKRLFDGKPIKLSDGSMHRIWAIRRPEIWAQASEDKVLEYFARWTNSTQPGGNPLEETAPL